QAEDGIRDRNVTGVQTCALPIYLLDAESGEMRHGDRGAQGAPPTGSRSLARASHQYHASWSACTESEPDPEGSGSLSVQASGGKIGRASCRERVARWGRPASVVG